MVTVALGPNSQQGNYSKAHGLGYAPNAIIVLPTSPSVFWAQVPFADATNFYFVASDVGVTALVEVP
jgi:hypothetical protein